LLALGFAPVPFAEPQKRFVEKPRRILRVGRRESKRRRRSSLGWGKMWKSRSGRAK
jgi:hypothetical protein